MRTKCRLIASFHRSIQSHWSLPFMVLSFSLVHILCYHLCYHLMLSFFTVSKCYHFYVIIFPCTYFVLSFVLSFDVIVFCYHFPPFFFFLKTWHTPIKTICRVTGGYLKARTSFIKRVTGMIFRISHCSQRSKPKLNFVLSIKSN